MPGSPPDPGRTEVVLSAGLAAVSGAVDVLAFTRLGHVFASVITGNLVVIGVSIGQGDLRTFAHGAASFLAYAVGVVLGSVAIRRAGEPRARWPVQTTVLCAAEFVVLLVVAGLWLGRGSAPQGVAQYLALAAAALAMGLQSAAFRMVGVPGVTTTYFTGTLTGLLAGLVTSGRLNVAALIALTALLAGATGSGVLVAHASAAAVGLPLVLLAAVLITSTTRRRALASPPRSG